MKVRVILVDDSWQAREGVREIVSSDPKFEVVGEAASGEEAIVLTGKIHPDLIFMDIQMPGMGGFEALKRIQAAHPTIKVVMVTASDSPEFRSEACNNGAAGCLQKNLDPAVWREYLRALASTI